MASDDTTPTPWWEVKEAELQGRCADDTAACYVSTKENVRFCVHLFGRASIPEKAFPQPLSYTLNPVP
jgi:hypothetical protein